MREPYLHPRPTCPSRVRIKRGEFSLKAWPVLGILIVQALLCLAHWFLYSTLIDFWWPLSPTAIFGLRIAFIALSASFMVAALLGFRFSNWLVALIYQLAAIWLGLLN